MMSDLGMLAEIERLEYWVANLQKGTYINCVYCGHCYGPDSKVPATMADVLKKHIAVCDRHPMAKLLVVCKETDHAIDLLLDPGIALDRPYLMKLQNRIKYAITEAEA